MTDDSGPHGYADRSSSPVDDKDAPVRNAIFPFRTMPSCEWKKVRVAAASK
jgi:hypothetical protein